MLERLETVPWSKLTHAYGPADDVPDQIRALANSDEDTRKNALWELYGNIFHQGTRYEATPHAVPFLYELLDAPETPTKEHIVYLLISIALGYEDEYLPGGLDAVALRRQLAQGDSRKTPSERAECDAKYGYGPSIDLRCYDAVRSGVPSLLRLLSDEESSIRRSAVYALAWFPEDAAESLPAIRHRLQVESESSSIAVRSWRSAC